MRSSRSLAPAHLLDLIGSGRGLGPFTAPIGLDSSGRTVWHDLHSATSRHLIVSGAGVDRCEAIRSVAVGLALTTRPALLQLLTIDATGRELLFLGTLPHAVLETAIDPASTRLSLGWLSEELGARRREGRPWPAILLVVDDLTALETGNNPGAARQSITSCAMEAASGYTSWPAPAGGNPSPCAAACAVPTSPA
jgi:hypothetical protein